MLSYAELGIRCLGIASSDADGKWVFRGNLTFSDPLHLTRKMSSSELGELGIQVKLITGDHLAIAKETCRVIGVGTQILTTKDIPAYEADTSVIDLESPWKVVTVLLESTQNISSRLSDGVNDTLALKKGEHR